MLGLINEIQRLLIVSAVKEGLAASRERGIIGGRPRTTMDNIPEVFFKYYAMYKNHQINKVEFSRITGLSRSSIYKYIDIIESKKEEWKAIPYYVYHFDILYIVFEDLLWFLCL